MIGAGYVDVFLSRLGVVELQRPDAWVFKFSGKGTIPSVVEIDLKRESARF